MTDAFPIKNLKDFDSRTGEEAPLRYQNSKKILKFGIPFLDEALGGIIVTDLVTYGAKTGIGKTQLAMHIALANASHGFRVVYFALEAAEYEIERRIKYQRICSEFFGRKDRPKIRLNYLDWLYGKFKAELSALEAEISSKISLPTLRIYYRDRNFTIEEFQRVYSRVKAETDLVIVDHLHYFDHDGENENKAAKEIMKGIKDAVDIARVPVVLISHIRKSDRKFKTLTPDLEDFHGSSDIAKISTKSFALSPGPIVGDGTTRGTYFTTLKHRDDGSRKDWTALLDYNMIHQRYESYYLLGRTDPTTQEFIATPYERVPFWAINSIQKRSGKC